MTYNAAEIGQTIRAYRKSAQMSQAELAKVIGKHPTAICKIESADAAISLEAAFLIAAYFGVTIDALLDGSAVRAARVAQLKAELAALEGGE